MYIYNVYIGYHFANSLHTKKTLTAMFKAARHTYRIPLPLHSTRSRTTIR